jgi:hypothetical protein
MPVGERLVNFISLAVGLLLIMVGQFVGAAILGPAKQSVIESSSHLGTYNGVAAINAMYRAVTVEVPLVAGAGLIALAAWREYRRQQITAPR